MALKNDFYSEIFEQERKWIEFINLNLLNSIYCDLTLKPFYLEKKKELEAEYNLTKNNIIGQFITLIDNIINEINLLFTQYNQLKDVNISSLIPLFLTTQMNNISQKKETVSTKDRLQIGKQILENQLQSSNKNLLDDSYLYYDFLEEKKVK